MAKPSRKKLILALVFVVLLGIFLPPNINGARFKKHLADTLSAALGRPVRIGSVKYRLLPRPGFDLYDFEVLDDPAYSAEPLLMCGEVTADLRLISLWQGRLEIANLKLKDGGRMPPSLNLVYSERHWNIESLLARAEQVPTAPTAKRSSESRPRFPYIEAASGRINLKIGPEKTSYALVNTDFAFWLAAEDQWHFRLDGKPVRTDMDLTDTGTIRLEGDFKRFPGLRETPVTIQASWRDAQLGQLSTLLWGHDKGWRGGISFTAEASGALNNLHLTASGGLENFRRYDIERGGMPGLYPRCLGEYTRGMMDFNCSLSVQNGGLQFRGQVSPTDLHNYDLSLVANRLPMAAVAVFARQSKRTLPDDLSASGELDAAFAFHSHDNTPRDWHGAGMTSPFELLSSQISRPLQINPVRFHLGPVEQVVPEKPSRRTKPAKPISVPVAGTVLSIEPFLIDTGNTTHVQISGKLAAENYSLESRGTATVDRLLDLGRIIGVPSHIATTSGNTNFEISLNGVWANFAPAHLAGSAHLRDVSAAVPGLISPLLISAADAQFTDAGMVLSNIVGEFERTPLAFTGSVTAPLQCSGEAGCAFQFDLHAPTLATADIAALLGSGKSGWSIPFVSGSSTEKLPVFQASGTLTVDTLNVAAFPLEKLTAHVEVGDQSVLLNSISAAVADGALHGDWRIDWHLSPPHYSGKGTLAGVSLERLPLPPEAAALLSTWISGKATADYSLELTGRNGEELLAGAIGEAKVSMTNGSSRAVALDSKPLRFQTLQGACSLNHGVLDLSSSKFKAENRIYEISGTVSLAEKKANLKVTNTAAQWNISGDLEKPSVLEQRLAAEKTGSTAHTR